MTTIVEGNLTFEFPDGWQAEQYDRWSFYRNQYQQVCNGTKAVDLLAIDQARHLWMIEAKDYRRQRRMKSIDLAEEVARKVHDTLAGLAAARCNANDDAERSYANASMQCGGIRIVLHLEQPVIPSKAFPMVGKRANIQARLKRLVKAIDPHPVVVDRSNTLPDVWRVT
jgi:hypothetical protein